MNKLTAAFTILVALFSAPVVYAADDCKSSLTRQETDEALNGTTKLVYRGKEAADFIRSLAETVVKAIKHPASEVDTMLVKLPQFDQVVVYVKPGLNTVLVTLYANDCLASAAEFPIQIVIEATEKKTS